MWSRVGKGNLLRIPGSFDRGTLGLLSAPGAVKRRNLVEWGYPDRVQHTPTRPLGSFHSLEATY